MRRKAIPLLPACTYAVWALGWIIPLIRAGGAKHFRKKEMLHWIHMRNILQHRGLRLIFAANMISMIGSGMNSAAVTWYVLQATHSEMALGTLLMLQTIPALLMLPFTGVVIDREHRRRLGMTLDAALGLVILVLAILAYRGMARLCEVYLMSILVAAGFWMFWPTINALIQELTPESQFVQPN